MGPCLVQIIFVIYKQKGWWRFPQAAFQEDLLPTFHFLF